MVPLATASPEPTVPPASPLAVTGAAFTVFVMPPQMEAVTVHTPLS